MKPIFETKKDLLLVSIYPTNREMGMAATEEAVEVIKKAIQDRGHANIIIATGNSQLSFLEALSAREDVDWLYINVFHMDEYVGIPADHPASFPLFLHRHIIDKVKPRNFYPIVGQTKDPEETCHRYEKLLRENPADLCALGIGENGHLAFIDPPWCDFNDPAAVRAVELDEVSRNQQVHDGGFARLEDVPRTAFSLTIPFIMGVPRAAAIVPGSAKRAAIGAALDGPVTTACPASILRRHPNATLFLDEESAALVERTET